MYAIFAALAAALSLSLFPMHHAAAQDPHAGHHEHATTLPDPVGVSMGRAGSGTSWIPDAVQLPGWHGTAGRWSVMLHGSAFLQYTHQSGPRGDSQLGSLNWAMLMLSRPAAGGRLQLRTMVSLDPLTVTNRGYPLLFQTGETYEGKPIVDRQHPHDVLMELGVSYERALTEGLGFQLYAAPSGEPALSPVAFMHRPSAMDDPFAPLAHHWQDATHVSFGVLTAGLFGRRWKLEASRFNGREPDEERWGIDRIKLDSWSARLSVNPTANWSASAGWGWLESPEALHPDESTRRFTAAVMHGTPLGTRGRWATTLAWGMNTHVENGHGEDAHDEDESHGDGHEGGHASHSILLESQAAFNGRHSVFARLEVSQRSAEDLAITDGPAEDLERLRNVTALSVGYVRELTAGGKLATGVGVRGTLNLVPAVWRETYGSRTPVGVAAFLRVRPQ